MNKILVFASGEGTNLQALIDSQNEIGFKIAMIICNRENAGAITKARTAGIPLYLHVWDRKVSTREQYDQQLLNIVLQSDFSFIVLAGWMHILSKEFIDGVGKEIINLHPALPGTFKGADGIGMAWEAYQKGQITETGTMVHYVVPEIDSGAVIATDRVPILANDTLETLRDRVRSVEKQTLLRAVQTVLQKDDPVYVGKVRSLYDRWTELQMVASNRCSAFDRHICDIPWKGYYLNKMSEWWFNQTQFIVPNHLLATKHDSAFVQKCTPFKVEVVVRGFMTGSTKTSLWTAYSRAMEAEGADFQGITYCGHFFPAGIRKNERLPMNVVTPTTKGITDVPITCAEVVQMGLMTQTEWDYVHDCALRLFSYGQTVADRLGLILVDTKYEFGKNSRGEILLIDELHTCDSSRYWLKEGYSLNAEPKKLDKDAIREWVQSVCDPYSIAQIPTPPTEVVQRVTNVYKEMYDRFRSQETEFPTFTCSPEYSLQEYLDQRRRNMAVIISGSTSDKHWTDRIVAAMKTNNIHCKVYFASAHKQPRKVLEILDFYNAGKQIVYVTCAGMSNALSGFTAANTHFPVIACPVFSDKVDMMVNINSTIQMPSQVPSMTVLSPGNVALAVGRILNLH